MAKSKPPAVDWLLEALRVCDALEHLPDSPPNKLTAVLHPQWDRRNAAHRTEAKLHGARLTLQDVLEKVSATLSVRLRTGKVPVSHDLAKAITELLEQRNPRATGKAFAAVQSAVGDFMSEDKFGLIAHQALARVLRDEHLTSQLKGRLPLFVALIGGAFTSQMASRNASQPRHARANILKDAKLNCKALNPYLTWKQLLDELEGDEVVLYWDEKTIRWRDENDDTKTTATKTFRNW